MNDQVHCPVCNHTFIVPEGSGETFLDRHLEDIHPTLTCPVSGCTYSSRHVGHYNRHLGRHKSHTFCSRCSDFLPVGTGLAEHNRMFHADDSSSDSGEETGAASSSRKRRYQSSDDAGVDNVEDIDVSNFADVPYGDLSSLYTLHLNKRREAAWAGVVELDAELRFSDRFESIDTLEIPRTMYEIFSNCIHILKSLSLVTEDSLVRVLVRCSTQTRHDGAFSTSFIPPNEAGADVVFELFEKMLNSNEDIKLDSAFSLNFVVVRLPTARVRGRPRSLAKRAIVDVDDWIKNKRCLQRLGPGLQNLADKHDACLPVALVLARQLSEYVRTNPGQHSKLLKTYMTGHNAVISAARELCTAAGVTFGAPCRISTDVEKFSSTAQLQDFEINIFSTDNDCTRILHFNADKSPSINLLVRGHHIYLIKSVHSMLGNHYCSRCNDTFVSRKLYEKHQCSSSTICELCGLHSCEATTPPYASPGVACPDCDKYYMSESCVKTHKEAKLCVRYTKCATCPRRLTEAAMKIHVCGSSYCFVCRCQQPVNHLCYMQKVTTEELEKKTTRWNDALTIFWDSETTWRDPGQSLTAICICMAYEHSEDGDSRTFFADDDDNDATMYFLRHLLTLKRPIICLAHYSKTFDSFLILNAAIRMNLAVKIGRKGQSICSLFFPAFKLKFMCTGNYIPASLRSFPKLFGLDDVEKSYGPFRLFRVNFLDRPFPSLPSQDYFPIEQMSSAELDDFNSWWETEACAMYNSGRQYVLREQLEGYCSTDVRVLRAGFIKFRETLDTFSRGLNPLYLSLTTTSFNNLLFRTFFLPDSQTLVNVPRGGYTRRSQTSKLASAWLAYLMASENLVIRSANTHGEAIVGAYTVDGLLLLGDQDTLVNYPEIPSGSKVVFEFNGCYHHGHRECGFFPGMFSKRHNCTFGELFDRTMKKKATLESMGYVVVSMWECAFNEEVKRNAQLRYVVEEDLSMRAGCLVPEHGLYGGRTEAIALAAFSDVDDNRSKETFPDANFNRDPDEKLTIHYMDVRSLYPYCQREAALWVGAPTILSGYQLHGVTVHQITGLVYGRFLYHDNAGFLPILPQRINKRLIFACCRSCAEMMSDTGVCHHSGDERSFDGVYDSAEVQLAVDEGQITVLRLYEAWHFKETSTELFRSYMNNYLKMKVLNSGRPAGSDVDPSIFDDYIREMQEDGIEVNKEDVVDNSSMKYVSKQFANSSWGFLALDYTKGAKTVLIRSAEAFLRFFRDETKLVTDVSIMTDKVILLSYKEKDGGRNIGSLSLLTAIQVTSFARRVLYSYLKKIPNPERRCLYMDTDSIIFLSDKGGSEIPVGHRIGMMEDEYPNSDILCYMALGPKCYTLLVRDKASGCTKWLIRAKGCKMTKEAEENFTADSIRQMILDHSNKITVEYKNLLRRKLESSQLTRIEEMTKIFKFGYTKRVLVQADGSDIFVNSMPFGLHWDPRSI